MLLGGSLALAAAEEARGDAARRIGRIELVTDDIYTADEVASTGGLLRLVRRGMNAVHAETRERIVRRELLFAVGDTVAPALFAETERNLRGLGYLTNVSVAPTDTLPDGTVGVRVHVQETWSLKTEFAWARSSSGQQRWNISLEDGNFLGFGAQLGLGAGRDEDRRFTSVAWRNRRVLGSRWRLVVEAADLTDGHALVLTADRPFYALSDAWSLETGYRGGSYSPRVYLSNAGPAGLVPDRRSSLWAAIPYRETLLRLALLRRVTGATSGRVWRVGVGFAARDGDYDLDGPALVLSDGRSVTSGFLAADGALQPCDAFARVGPIAVAQSAGRRWTTASYLLKYGTVEDVPLDPALRLEVGWAARALGSGRGAVLCELAIVDWSRAAGGLLLTQAEGAVSLGGSAIRTSRYDLVAGWFARGPGGLTRLFGEAAWGDRLAGREAFTLGLTRGLRTLEYDGMAGDRLVRWNAEQGWPLPGEILGFYRLGLAVFYGGGVAWWRGEPRGPGDARHEAGLGLRLGSSRSARADVARLDVAWPQDGGGGPVLTAVTGGFF